MWLIFLVVGLFSGFPTPFSILVIVLFIPLTLALIGVVLRGAGPHFCAGAWASRAMIADVALPTVFARAKQLEIADDEPVRIGGWAFRGLQNLPVRWQ